MIDVAKPTPIPHGNSLPAALALIRVATPGCKKNGAHGTLTGGGENVGYRAIALFGLVTLVGATGHAIAQPSSGEKGGRCYGNGSCDDGLQCDLERRICVASGATKTQPVAKPGVTPAPPPTAAPTPPPQMKPRAKTCFPACRSGYTCNAGTCISLCNPPCSRNQKCTAAGECTERRRATTVVVQPAPLKPPNPALAAGKADPGWADGAGSFGYVMAIAVGALAFLAEGDDGTTFGSVATGLFAVSGIIVSSGGSSARTHPMVKGAPSLRTTAWIGYVVFLVDAVAALALAFNDEVVTREHVLSLGALGTLTLIAFSLDAKRAAAQARAVRKVQLRTQGASFQVRPALSVARGITGGRVGLLGARLRF